MDRSSNLCFILAILYFITIELVCNGHTHIGNNVRSERKALIDFKSGLKDLNNRLSSWKGSNYCYWQGISCENGTGLVISIDLHNPYPRENVYESWNSMNLSGEISPSLIRLKSLKYLDLSFNSFEAISIPQFFGSLKNLIYLNLSGAGFSGAIPSNLGNLSNLQYLDLSNLLYLGEEDYKVFFQYDNVYFNDLFVENIEWMTGLVSLKYLGMNHVNLSLMESQWVEVLSKLPILTQMHLEDCSLFGSFPSSSFVNFTSLAVIAINDNQFNSKFPEWLLNVSSLVSIDISSSQLHGRIPDGLGELPNLQYLDLFGNSNLRGSVSQLLRESWKKIEFLGLGNNDLHGSIPSSIGNFCNLKYLDLSNNDLNGSLPEIIKGVESCSSKSPLPNLTELYLLDNQLMGKLPNWLGEIKNLTRLYLWGNELEGPIPASLGTLQHLEFLYLQSNELNGSLPDSIGQLSQLQYLDVSGNHLSGSLPQSIGQLSQLRELRLFGNQLQGSIPSSIGNFCNLKFLGLSDNSLNGSLPEIIKGLETCSSKSPLPNLTEIYLDYNQLMGKFPNWLGEIKNLRTLDLLGNKLEGPIPASFWTLQHLESVSFRQNELNGSLPNSIGQLSQLHYLDVSSNHLSGSLSEQHFWKLSKLEYLNMGFNSFHLNVSPNWIPPFQVTELHMGSCHLGPSFPAWLQSQKNLQYLDFSNGSILSPIPNWFWNISFNLQRLNLSHNQLQGQLPNSLKFSPGDVYIDFSSNLFEGPIPFSIKEASILDLSHNKFSGPIPLGISESSPNLIFLSLSGNRITGTIPDSIGHMSSLEVIDFSRNNLTGSIPSTINNCSSLIILDLGNNNLFGMIPKSLGQLKFLESLNLNHNKLLGELPSSLQNLTGLDVFDLSYNRLSGQVPAWIGVAFSNLVILNLRSNMFTGRLPSQLSNLSSLHVLDLAQNNLMGEIPVTLVELKAMVQEQLHIYQLIVNFSSLYEERLVVTTKGQSLEYTRTLSLVVSIDLSDNNLSGEFPQGIAKLTGLVVLNLSRNHITGQIPESISLLHQLSSLDLSSNKLFGIIPSSMSLLTFLGYLNLSNNNFSGKIPFIGQMTTFPDSAFVGNPNLCGPPLVTKCQGEDLEKRPSAIEDNNGSDYIDQWFYLSIGLGFAMGILVPYFVLAIKESWCEAYFDFVDKILKWLLRGRATYTRNHPRRRNGRR